MNQYARMAQQHWRRWLPERYRTIADPGSFFSTLGEEVAQEITELSLQLAGEDPPGEGYLAKLGRLNMAKHQAEAQVLRERVLLPPEPNLADEDQSQDQGQDEEPGQPPGEPEWTPLVTDPTGNPTHPYWQQVMLEQQQQTR